MTRRTARHGQRALLAAFAVAALLAGCSSVPLPPPGQPVPVVPPAVVGPAQPAVVAPTPGVATAPTVNRISIAGNPRAYRQDAASHLYGLHPDRIWKGRLPPMLYAIGVVQVDVDRQGQVRDIHWMRAPRHAPEVVAEIERMVRAAAPFPVPARMGRVTYTDTWLWHQSGKFQLDTLTEGQD
jgi:periplasmic protein TonB